MSKPDPEASLDKAVFFGSSGLLLIITAGFMMRPESSALLLDELYVFVTSRIGVVYIFAAIFTLGWQRALLASLGPSGLRAGRRVGILQHSAPKHQQATYSLPTPPQQRETCSN